VGEAWAWWRGCSSNGSRQASSGRSGAPVGGAAADAAGRALTWGGDPPNPAAPRRLKKAEEERLRDARENEKKEKKEKKDKDKDKDKDKKEKKCVAP
jgi:hypothetical protein